MHADLTHVALILTLVFCGGLFIERLRQPALVGYLLMGALIGPGLLGPQGDDETIRWLAELAIVLLMFMLGLELDIRAFRHSIRLALGVALAQAAVGVAAMLGLTLIFPFSVETAILLGLVTALSSTAVAMTMLRGRGGSDSRVAPLATAILIAQDILAIPMILVVTVLGEGFSLSGLMHLGLSLSVIAGSFVGIFELVHHPRWVEKLESFFSRGTTQPVVAAMALCFGAAALSGAVGLSTAYGAFALGLLIGNVGTIGASYRHAVEPIHELLMMVYFLSVGLMLDVRFILENLLLIATLLGVTIALKTILTVAIARIVGLDRSAAISLGAVLGQIGEFSFVLLSLGLANGFLGHKTYQLGLSIIALSLMLSPLWFASIRALLRAAHVAPAAQPTV